MTSATPSARLHAFLLPRPEIVQFLPRLHGAARSPLVRVVTSAGRLLRLMGLNLSFLTGWPEYRAALQHAEQGAAHVVSRAAAGLANISSPADALLISAALVAAGLCDEGGLAHRCTTLPAGLARIIRGCITAGGYKAD